MLSDGRVSAPQWPARGQYRPVSASQRPGQSSATGRASSPTGGAVLPRRARQSAATGRAMLPRQAGQCCRGRLPGSAAGADHGRSVSALRLPGRAWARADQSELRSRPVIAAVVSQAARAWPVSAPRQVSQPPRRPDEPQRRGIRRSCRGSDGAVGPGMSAGPAGPAWVRLVQLSVMGVLMIAETGQRYPLTDCRSNESGIAAWPQCPDPVGPNAQRPAEAGRAGQRRCDPREGELATRGTSSASPDGQLWPLLFRQCSSLIMTV